MTGIIFTIGMIITRVATDMADCHDIISNPLAQALIKDKILALEFRVQTFFPDIVGILNNTTLELVYILKTMMDQIGTSFFTPDASCAVKQDLFSFFSFKDPLYCRKEILRCFHIRYNGMVETADLTLIIITHIHDGGIWVFEDSVLFYRGKVIAHTVHNIGCF